MVIPFHEIGLAMICVDWPLMAKSQNGILDFKWLNLAKEKVYFLAISLC